MDSSSSDASVPAQGWGLPLALAALIFCVYSFFSGCSTIWDRDEARFSRATAEMVSTGNYLYPTFNGKLRPDKPILIYWLMALPVSVFGQSEWAFRFCSVFATALACLFTYFIGRRLFNHRTGLWAMVLLAANPLMLYTGTVATSDAVLLAFMTGAFAVYADALKSHFCGRRFLLMALCFTGGMLTKGPVALLPLIPIVLTQILLRREAGPVLPVVLKLGAGALVAGAAFAAWFYPANQATHGDLFRQQIGHHFVDRLQKPLENHGGYSPFYMVYYPLVIVAAFFPWTLYLPGALARLLKRLDADRPGRVFLMAWIGPILLVMLAVSTKLPHYILPIWPALALSIGAFLDETAHEDAPSPGAWYTFSGGLLFLLVAIAVAAGLGFGPEYMAEYAKKPEPLWKAYYGDDSRSMRSVFGAFFLIVAFPLIFRHRVAHFTSNARILAVAAMLFALAAGALLVPSFERIKISKRLVDPIKTYVAGAPVTVCGYNEASLIFYVGRNVEDIVPEKPATKPTVPAPPEPQAVTLTAPEIIEDAVSAWSQKGGPGVLIIPQPMFEKISEACTKKGKPLAPLLRFHEITGYNYSKDKWVDVLVMRRQN